MKLSTTIETSIKIMEVIRLKPIIRFIRELIETIDPIPSEQISGSVREGMMNYGNGLQ